jgi:hypothetical protein
MRKYSTVIITITFFVLLALGLTASSAKADSGILSGEWNTGTGVPIDLVKNPAPGDWLQLFGSGVQLNGPATICHSFRGARFGWTPVIYQLADGHWNKLPTTITLPDTESEDQACATTSGAGTYALFAYYIQPAEVAQPACTLDTSVWEMAIFDAALEPYYPGITGMHIFSVLPNVSEGKLASYEITQTDPAFIGFKTGTTFVYLYPGYDFHYADFMDAPISREGPFTIQVRLTAMGCSRVFTLTESDFPAE